MATARVPRTMSFTPEKSGQAVSILAPRLRNTRIARWATAATSSSTGRSPRRSGAHAIRQPLTDGALTARANWLVATSYEIGARSSGPAIAESISAQSATVRARGPVTLSGSQASVLGYAGTRPGVGRNPSTPQNDAGTRTEPPRSVP